MSKGAELIAAERKRQIEVEGWKPEHDAAKHRNGELAKAAACYAAGMPIYYERRISWMGDPRIPNVYMTNLWPWDAWDYKPKDRITNLVRAGALIAAEIDRLLAEREALSPKEVEPRG